MKNLVLTLRVESQKYFEAPGAKINVMKALRSFCTTIGDDGEQRIMSLRDAKNGVDRLTDRLDGTEIKAHTNITSLEDAERAQSILWGYGVDMMLAERRVYTESQMAEIKRDAVKSALQDCFKGFMQYLIEADEMSAALMVAAFLAHMKSVDAEVAVESLK